MISSDWLGDRVSLHIRVRASLNLLLDPHVNRDRICKKSGNNRDTELLSRNTNEYLSKVFEHNF
jgi:hypothetical protein